MKVEAALKSLCIIVVLIALVFVSSVHAYTTGWPIDPSINKSDIYLSYEVTPSAIAPFTSNVYDVITFNQYATGGSGAWWPSSVSSTGGTIVDPFAKSSTNMPLSGFILGLVNDASDTAHLVVMMSNSAAASAAKQSFDTVFQSQAESQIISDLKFSMENDRNSLDTAGQTKWDAALNNIWFNFALGDAATSWFNLGTLPYPSAPGTIVTSDFSVMQWSDGDQIGTGIASLKYYPPASAPIPEPGTILLFGAGLFGLVIYKKRS